jgi:hypothetical protein
MVQYVIYFVNIGFCGKSKALSGQREIQSHNKRVSNCVLRNGVHCYYTGGIPFVKFWTN